MQKYWKKSNGTNVVFSTNDVGAMRNFAEAKRMNINQSLKPHKKVNSEGIMYLSVKLLKNFLIKPGENSPGIG